MRLAWWCHEWDTTPDDGGLFDQDYKLMREMSSLSNVYSTVRYVSGLEGKAIHKMSDAQRRLIAALIKEGLM